LLDEYKFTQEKLSDRVGKKRATVANYLRLLKLPAEIQLGLTKKEIDMGHARALINVQDPTKMIKLYEEVVAKGYSVRKVEELVRQLNEEGEGKEKKSADPELQQAYTQIADRLSNIFGAKVKVDRNEKGKGKISLVFSSDEELENILMVIDSIKN
jgi:ParB family chromosome partitioning protein